MYLPTLAEPLAGRNPLRSLHRQGWWLGTDLATADVDGQRLACTAFPFVPSPARLSFHRSPPLRQRRRRAHEQEVDRCRMPPTHWQSRLLGLPYLDGELVHL